MLGYLVARPLTLSAASLSRTLRPARDFAAPAIDEVHVPALKELDLVRKALAVAYPDEPEEALLRVLTPATLAQMPGFPVRLGVAGVADPLAATGCLVGQLRALRAAMPDRSLFRVLLANGFGGNLGDNLIGLTAFRQVLVVLRAEWPEVAVDVMLGWHADDRLDRIYRDADGIDRVLAHGPTLAELSRYQAFFDTDGLLTLPRYGRMPMVDWYLWWMGLDPALIAPAEKRNAVAVPAAVRQSVAAGLPPERPRIVVNPQASVALRSMPEATCRRIVMHLLDVWPQARVVLTQSLEIEHPRVHDLSAALPSVDHLAALLAGTDGLIGVDTFTLHLADATATPAVTVFTSVSADLYPYYPLGEAMSLPDAERLPAWGKMKTSREAWPEFAAAYASAWQDLAPEVVLAALQRAMARKAVQPSVLANLLPPREGPLFPATRPFGEDRVVEVPARQRDEPLAASLWRTLADVGRQVLCRGDTVAVLGAGAGEGALPLAQRVGHQGRLIAFEPRRELHLRLCANLASAGIAHAETHAAMPEGETFAVRRIGSLHVDDEYAPLRLDNCAQPEPVVCWPLDALAPESCRLLAVCAPLPLLSVLEAARATIERLHPVVLAGVLHRRDAALLEGFFAALPNYATRQIGVGDLYAILLATPVESRI